MLPSKAAAVLPPPPDPYAARIPRQWSPVEQILPKATATLAPSHHISGSHSHPAHVVQPTLPSLVVPAQLPLPRSTAPSIPVPPSSLGGLAMPSVDTTARVRTSAVAGSGGKLARPTLSWAAALVALGIFVGIGSAVVNRSEALKAKAAAGQTDGADKPAAAKNASTVAAKAAPVASAKITSASTAIAANAPPPPPLPPSLTGDPTAPVVAAGGVGAAGPSPTAPAAVPAPIAADPAAAPAAGVGVLSPPPPVAAPAPGAEALAASPNALVAAPPPRGRPAAAPPAPARPRAAARPQPQAQASAGDAEEAPAPPPPSKTSPKKRDVELSQQARDLADEQLKSLLQ